MIILLEGADCSGKTTLAEALQATRGPNHTYYHNTHETNGVFNFSAQLKEAMREHVDGKLVIIDRMWLSEAIYGNIMRDGSNDPQDVVYRLALTMPIINVVCVRDDITKHIAHFKDVEKTRHEYASRKIEQVIMAYNIVWNGGRNPITTGLVNLLSLYAPLYRMRGFYQYDMDRENPLDFAAKILESGGAV